MNNLSKSLLLTFMIYSLGRDEIKEFVVNCISNLSRALGKNIKSGWTTVLRILTLSGGVEENRDTLTKECFNTCIEMLKMHFPLISEYFEEMIKCLFSYTKSNDTDIALEAIQYLISYSAHIHNIDSPIIHHYFNVYLQQHQEYSHQESQSVVNFEDGELKQHVLNDVFKGNFNLERNGIFGIIISFLSHLEPHFEWICNFNHKQKGKNCAKMFGRVF
jgi:hypothetical protein